MTIETKPISGQHRRPALLGNCRRVSVARLGSLMSTQIFGDLGSVAACLNEASKPLAQYLLSGT